MHAHRSGMPPGGRPEDVPPFLHGLQLDEAQRDKVFMILHAQAPQLREQEKTRHKAQQELGALVLSGQYSDGKAKKLIDTLARSTAEIALIRARSDSQIVALLTPGSSNCERIRQAHRRTTLGVAAPIEPGRADKLLSLLVSARGLPRTARSVAFYQCMHEAAECLGNA